jgi:hypothetical protein
MAPGVLSTSCQALEFPPFSRIKHVRVASEKKTNPINNTTATLFTLNLKDSWCIWIIGSKFLAGIKNFVSTLIVTRHSPAIL